MLRIFPVIVAVLSILAFTKGDTVQVNAPTGVIIGLSTSNADKFMSIPFAEPPIGRLRFNSPVAKAPWTTPLMATEDPPGCPQECELPPHTCPEKQSESCLFLNVFRPRGTTVDTAHLPVMVFFHGGNYKQGYSGGLLYDSSKVAEQANVLVVTVNYRLGALGYLAVPEARIRGNYGVLDQIQSLRWVIQNIASFGGDPSRITIFGQSAGAGSVAALLGSPAAKGLFQNAILHSNPFSIPFRSVKSMSAIAGVLAKNLGCELADTSCFLQKSVDEIITAQVAAETDMGSAGDSFLSMFLPWTPMVDGDIVPMQPQMAFQQNQIANVPIMLGATKDEADIFILKGFETEVDSLKYAIMVNLIFGFERASKITTRFPGKPAPHDHREQLITEANEYIFHCSNRNVTQAMVAHGRKPFIYLFDHVMSFSHDSWGPDFPMCYEKVCHAGELPFFFNSAHVLYDYTEEEKVLARSMIRYWGNFAHTGNPNNGPVPQLSQIEALEVSTSHLLSEQDLGEIRALGDVSTDLATTAPANWPHYEFLFRNVMRLTVASSGGNGAMENWNKDNCGWWDREIQYIF